MTTEMTTAEKWREVAQRMAGGAFFSDAVYDVLDCGPIEACGEATFFNFDILDNVEYETYYVILCEFLALEAEDDLWADVTPEPVTMVADEEPIGTVTVTGTVAYCPSSGAALWIEHSGEPTEKVERRIPWNRRIADGLRKWADWMEERF